MITVDIDRTGQCPAADAPIAADIELCSLSTGINSVSTCPFATNEAKYCGISVDGVIGNAGNTSGLICLKAIAIASFPDKRSLFPAILFHSFHRNCTERTCFYTNAASFAMVIIKCASFHILNRNTTVWTDRYT